MWFILKQLDNSASLTIRSKMADIRYREKG
jgi:hypothetical protein